MKTNSYKTIHNIIYKIILPKKQYIIIGLLLIIINKICGLVLPGASKYIIDNVIVNKDIKMLKIVLSIVLISIVFQALSSYLLTKILSVNAQKLVYEMRVNLVRKIIYLPISFFNKNTSGSIISRIMNDVEGAKNFIGTGLVQIIGGILTIIICFCLLLRINYIMTLCIIIPIIIFFAIFIKFFVYIRPIFKEKSILQSKITSRLNEMLNGIHIIKCFNAEEKEINIFSKNAIKLLLNIQKCLIITSFMNSISILIIGFSVNIIMGIGSYFIINNIMTLGDFISFTMYLSFMIIPIIQISNIISQLTESIAGLDRNEEIMNIFNDITIKKHKLNTIKGDIQLKNICLIYDNNNVILKDISFNIPANSTTALVGLSGSGKSSIAYMIAGLIYPTKGNITIDGYDLNNVDLYSYRKYIGVVLQNDFLFDGTIKDNIVFAKPYASNLEIENAINKSYVNLFIKDLPDGINTTIGERGYKLSGGQRQRISIARAILINPKINIFDEATSSLDTQSEFLIQKSLSILKKNKTTIIIAHRLCTIKSADQIIVIENGSIAEMGNHNSLMNQKGKYYKLFTYQSNI